ncbi:hypothetical protein SERLA73DRAFT_85086, partial [Serpula lacrymans var. lacrymans S7.3]
MVLWLLFVIPLPVLAALDKTHGVSPALVSKYAPVTSGSSPTWQCLDGSKEIAWSAVNDDYCDCPDGSDEPGTSACPNSVFYCRNEGHIGATIRSSRVNDGICEPECCDGSDELLGVCENHCRETGDAYRQQQDAERKLHKTGSKIRSTYIAFAHKEKKRMEALIALKEQEITAREKEVARLRDIAERAESISAVELEHKKESQLYQSLTTHHTALKSLQAEHKRHLEREKALGEILDSLRTGYNPNYQDMAVLEAVRGWETLAGLPHINDVAKDGGEEGANDGSQTKEDEQLEEGMWNAEQIEKEMKGLLSTDHISLLLEYEKHINAPGVQSVLFDVPSYLPEALVPQYEGIRDTVTGFLQYLGIVHGTADASAESNQARKNLDDAEHSLRLTREEEKNARLDLSDLFDPDGFGPQGEWKKLDGLCLSKDTGDYTYEVCLFDEARQKPNKG